MPPCTMGCWMPSISVMRVFIAWVSLEFPDVRHP
jgi:hypothetical protein